MNGRLDVDRLCVRVCGWVGCVDSTSITTLCLAQAYYHAREFHLAIVTGLAANTTLKVWCVALALQLCLASVLNCRGVCVVVLAPLSL